MIAIQRAAGSSPRGEALNAWHAGVSGIYTFDRFDPRDPIFREPGSDPADMHFASGLWYNRNVE